MLSQAAKEAVLSSTPSSFSLDLKAWLNIMMAYENGGHAYHATMPTDGLKQLRDTLLEAKQIGYDNLKQAQIKLGQEILATLHKKKASTVSPIHQLKRMA